MLWSKYIVQTDTGLYGKIKAGHPPIDVPLFVSITLEGGYIDQKPLLEAGDSNLLIIEFVDPAASSSVPHTNCIAELTLPCIFVNFDNQLI